MKARGENRTEREGAQSAFPNKTKKSEGQRRTLIALADDLRSLQRSSSYRNVDKVYR